jgi:hypothetical protein
MRHIKVLSGLNQAIEDFGYAFGEAQDFIDREDPHLCDLIDDVAFGRLSSNEAKRVVHEVFAKARRDVGEWSTLRADVATDGGFPYLHPSLKVGRVIAMLPDGVA